MTEWSKSYSPTNCREWFYQKAVLDQMLAASLLNILRSIAGNMRPTTFDIGFMMFAA
jgi:hypothetical protein